MNKKQNYLHSRNNYFFGKLMTVRDFEDEQIYLNSKRCLINRMLNGVGIVSGLGVLLVDNRTVSIESGMAIDAMGREIIIPESIVKRLNVIDGFEENKDNEEIYLCVAYDEQLTETTFSVAGSSKDSGEGKEYNRVNEGYKLFITSEKPSESILNLDYLITNKLELYKKSGVKIWVEIDKYVNPGNDLKVSVILEKQNVQLPVNYKFTINSELFKTDDGNRCLEVNYQENEVSAYKKVVNDYYLSCDAVSDAITDLVIKNEDFSIVVGQEFNNIGRDIKNPVNVITSSVRDKIIDSYYSKSFNEIIEYKEEQNIYLAKFSIVSNNSTFFIEDFKNNPFKQHIINNQLLDLLQKGSLCHSVKRNIDDLPKKLDQKVQDSYNVNDFMFQPEIIKSGVERIDFGLYSKPGKVYYSHEFVHGLGYGDVGVITSVDNKETYITNEPNSIVFGDMSVFSTDEISLSLPKISIGTMVNTEKGTMKIGVKLLEKTSTQYVNIRWWAFKSSDEDETENIVVDNEVKVVIAPNTTQIEPLGQVRLSAKVENCDNQDVVWSVVENGAGIIDENGVYEAPVKEGVYEIQAKSVQCADKYDSAYIVVSSL